MRDGSTAPTPRIRAFATFCVLERSRICGALRALTGGHRDVEDAVQEALLLARHRWAEVGAYAHPEAWVVRVALRMLVRWRGQDRDRFAELADDPVDGAAERAFSTVERTTDLAAAIASLPPRQRDVLTLHYRLDLPVEQIAEVLELRPGTVRSALSRGRDALALRWTEAGS
jgi:RNA polymerase sigma-70 factor (ECF subfamily)